MATENNFKSWNEIENPVFPKDTHPHDWFINACYRANGLELPLIGEVFGKEPDSAVLLDAGELFVFDEKYTNPIEKAERSRVKRTDDGWVLIKHDRNSEETYDICIKNDCKHVASALRKLKHMMEKEWMTPFMIDKFIDCMINQAEGE